MSDAEKLALAVAELRNLANDQRMPMAIQADITQWLWETLGETDGNS